MRRKIEQKEEKAEMFFPLCGSQKGETEGKP